MLKLCWFCVSGMFGVGLLIFILGFSGIMENLNQWKWISLEKEVPGHIVYGTFNEPFGYWIKLLLLIFIFF